MTAVTQCLAEGSGRWQLAINIAEVTAFLHLKWHLSVAGTCGVSAGPQDRRLLGHQREGWWESETFRGGPGAEHEALFSAFFLLLSPPGSFRPPPCLFCVSLLQGVLGTFGLIIGEMKESLTLPLIFRDIRL